MQSRNVYWPLQTYSATNVGEITTTTATQLQSSSISRSFETALLSSTISGISEATQRSSTVSSGSEATQRSSTVSGGSEASQRSSTVSGGSEATQQSSTSRVVPKLFNNPRLSPAGVNVIPVIRSDSAILNRQAE